MFRSGEHLARSGRGQNASAFDAKPPLLPSPAASATLMHMVRALRTLPLPVRAALLALLVLGTMLRTGLQLVGEVHAAEHDLHAAATEHGHTHGPEGDQPLSPQPGQPSHGEGTHALMHQAGGVAFADVTFAVDLVASAPGADAPAWYRPVALAASHPATPFRPPIA